MINEIALLVGAALAVFVGLLTMGAGMHRDRALYPVITMVVASYYVLFAAMGGSTHTLLLESLVALVFIAVSICGFRWSLWIVAAALVAHGILDTMHDRLIANPGVPAWWPEFCAAFDVAAGLFLAVLIGRGRVLSSLECALQKRNSETSGRSNP